MTCKCVSCSISRALKKGTIPKGLSDFFLLGCHYYAMCHSDNPDDAGWHSEGVDFYMNEILAKDYPNNRQVKKLIEIIKKAKKD